MKGEVSATRVSTRSLGGSYKDGVTTTWTTKKTDLTMRGFFEGLNRGVKKTQRRVYCDIVSLETPLLSLGCSSEGKWSSRSEKKES